MVKKGSCAGPSSSQAPLTVWCTRPSRSLLLPHPLGMHNLLGVPCGLSYV